MIGRSRARSSEAGVATLEMVVAAPFLLLMFLLIADFGRVFYTAITLAHAARAGAAYGAQSNEKSVDSAGMVQAAHDEAQNIPPITVTAEHFCECPGGTPADCTTDSCGTYGPPQLYVRVTASLTFRTIVLSFLFIPSTVPLSQTAVVRVQ